MKKTEVTCVGCGKKLLVTCGEGHTGIVKCECGATTTVQGEAGPILEQLNKLLEKVPAILTQLKESRRKGFETGMDDALHEVVMSLSRDILKEDPELRAALRDRIREALAAGILGEPGDPEASAR